MSKTRLLSWMKDKFIIHLKDHVKPKKEWAALEKAYLKAEVFVRKIVVSDYPLKDMGVLEKYDCAKIDDCIKVQGPTHDVVEFHFVKGTGPVVPNKYHTYSGKMYLVAEKEWAAIDAWRNARDAFKEAKQTRLKAYDALIKTANTLDDIYAVWPEAEKIVPRPSPTAVILFNPEQISLIKSDLAEQRAAT